MKKIISIFVAALASLAFVGCTTDIVKDPSGVSVVRHTFATDHSFKTVDIQVSTNGEKHVKIEGYNSHQDAAAMVQGAVSAAVQAAVQGAKGSLGIPPVQP